MFNKFKEMKLRNKIDDLDIEIRQNIELKEQCKDELIELINNKDSLPCFLNFNIEKEQLNYDIQRYEFYIEELVAELKHCLYELSIL